MLRIHVEKGPRRVRIRLEGKLVGPWVKELERCWQCALSRVPSSAVTVELEELTFIDSEAQTLLTAICRSGAQLRARGALCRFVVERIQLAVLVVKNTVATESIEGEGA
jgi:hypothetical protein